ncbi:MAG: site-specific integrase, partial [Spirochaetia bacterium]
MKPEAVHGDASEEDFRDAETVLRALGGHSKGTRPSEGTTMVELLQKAPSQGREKVEVLARMIATEAPELEELSDEQLQHLAKAVVAEIWKDDLRSRVELAGIDYQAERDIFIERSSHTGSMHTKDAYRRALRRLDDWCATKHINPLALTPAKADDWIEALKAQGRSSASVRLDVAAASTFWTWMERRHEQLQGHNPFRGTRARPARKPARKLEVPSEAEVEVLIAMADPEMSAAIVCMAHAGMRVGALPSLSINGTQWTAMTKGKEQSGTAPEEMRKAITRANLPLRAPFAG